MGLNNELKALRGCDFHAWKQIEHGRALCVRPLEQRLLIKPHTAILGGVSPFCTVYTSQTETPMPSCTSTRVQ